MTSPLDDLLERWTIARQSNRPLSPEELCRDCPELRDELKSRIAAIESMEKLMAETVPPRPSASADDSSTLTQTSAQQTDSAKLSATNQHAIPGYEILGELGRGGMGVVYKARQVKLNRIVALKMILSGGHASTEQQKRFLAEAEAIASVQHPNIVQIHEMGEHNGLPYFTLEFVDGGSLAAMVRENPLSPRDAAILVEQIARGVQCAHDRGVIHRDLKPENVLLHRGFTAEGAENAERKLGTSSASSAPSAVNLIPKVTDFGLAKQVQGGNDLTQTGAIMGTPSYMAPEQAEGKKEVGPPADVYALGAILYRLIVGRPPFQAATPIDTIMQVMNDEPVAPRSLNAQIPRDLETICLKCLQKNPMRRYESAEALAEDLTRYLNDQPIVARSVGAVERTLKWVRRNAVASGTSATVMLALIVGASVSYMKYVDAERSRIAESERVAERDAALSMADKRERALEYQLGVSNFLLANSAYENGDTRSALERLDKVPYEQRHFDWHRLRRKSTGGVFTIYGHTGGISTARFSPDGHRIVTGGSDRMAKIWHASTGRSLLDLPPHSYSLKSLSFSPDGRRIVTGGYETTAHVYDAVVGLLLHDLKGHKDFVNSVSFSSDGSRIVTGSKDNTATVWDADSGAPLLNLKGHTSSVTSARFSSDGRHIVTGSEDKTVRIWNAETGAAVIQMKGHGSSITSVGFSPDGHSVASGSEDKTAKLWSASTGALLIELKGHRGGVRDVSFSPDGQRLVTGSEDKTAIVWDALKGSQLLVLKGHTSNVSCASFSPDGERVLTCSADATAKVWDATSGSPLLILKEHMASLNSVCFSTDGSKVVISFDKTAKVFDAVSGVTLLVLEGHTSKVRSACFSPDGSRILTGSDDQTAKLWNAANGELAQDFRGHTGYVTSIDFSPDGRLIVTASTDHTAKVWNAVTGAVVTTLSGHNQLLSSARFSPDGSRIVTGNYDDRAIVWDLATGTKILDLHGHKMFVTSAEFSPDGRRIVTGSYDQTARVWDSLTGVLQLELRGHAKVVTSVGFSSDGQRIVTASEDTTAKIWDAVTGVPLLDLNGHLDAVTDVSISENGSRIVTSSTDGTTRIWESESNNESDSLSYRITWTQARPDRHRKDFNHANKAKRPFAGV